MGPKMGPFRPPKKDPFWRHIYMFYITNPPKRGSQEGSKMDPPRGPPRGVPRGPVRGGKKCTFFWVFNNSPSRDSLGHFFAPPGTAPLGQDGGSTVGSVLIPGVACPSPMAGPLGRRASGGTHRPALRPMGGTCPPEEVLPQGKDGSPRRTVRLREGGSRLREPNVADDWSDRQGPEVPRRAS